MPSLAFMPWLKLREDLDFEQLLLLRYEIGALPFGKGTSGQSNVDAVLACYQLHNGKPVQSATIFKLKEKEIDSDLEEEELNFLFEVAQIVAFAGLCSREYFGLGLDYWNSDHFYFLIQNFKDPQDGLAIVTRRRDGTTTKYYSGGTFSQKAPLHVDPGTACKLYIELAKALLKSRESAQQGFPLSDAIFYFNRANTDDYGVPQQQEVVMLLGAFQRLLECRSSDWDELAERFVSRFKPSEDLDLEKSKKLPGTRHEGKVKTLREAWIRDFYLIRGDLAHGKTETAKPLAWTQSEHLLLGTFAFPLLAKIHLAENGYYSLTDDDILYINIFEKLADEELFRPSDDKKGSGDWIWNIIVSDAKIKAIIGEVFKIG